jgi:2,3-bisphosphoglycerate-independent phosphoglycerate mutase
MDGIGLGPADDGNAVRVARTPNLDRLWREFPTRSLRAHGTAVGLPADEDMGNSEVGHNAMGAGRVIRQGAALVNDALGTGRIFSAPCWQWLVEGLRAAGTLHLCGLLSDGNVHSHIDQVFGLIRGAAGSGVRRLRIHALADGRDVPDPSFEEYLARTEAFLAPLVAEGLDYRIASGGGRMRVTMDRYEADWRIVARGWQAHVHGVGPRFGSVGKAVAALRQEEGGDSDQTLGPFVIVDETGDPIGRVEDGDSFVFWNFRGDRALELTRAFEEGASFRGFDRGRLPEVRYAGMMQYDGDTLLPRHFLVPPPEIDRTMGEYLVALGLRTLAVSETQKFGHVTYFWNGNRSGRLDETLERYVEVPSDRISFDEAPALKAREITDVVLDSLASARVPDFIRLNYANGDMVGHTGDMAATIVAVETVDREIGRLIEAAAKAGAVLVVTADHGNADDMWMRDKAGRPQMQGARPEARTSHTLAPVPFTIIDPRRPLPWRLREDLPAAGLAEVAATLFDLLGYAAPPHMNPSLLAANQAR